MRATLVVHIAAGSVALIAGYIALYAAKGAAVHRASGRIFVYAMLAMALCGVAVTVARQVAPAINIPAGLITLYLVITSLLTVRPVAARGTPAWLHVALMLLALGVGLTSLVFGAEAIANGGMREDMPAFPFLMFGVVGVLSAAGDWRMLRAGPPRGSPRLVRHLWRMSFALFIAAMSFFIGQAKVIPEPLRHPALLALPVVAVLVTMLYWLWRVRVRRSLRGLALVGSPEPARPV